jgi:pimeloyl-ACP methyl ester carboxylesterase
MQRRELVMVDRGDGTRVALHDFGGEGPPLLFAHGTGFHGLIWKPVADQLRDDFHCWAVDLRGHGDSAIPSGDDMDWAGFGRDVIVAAEEMGQSGKITGVGHSLGGTALVMAELQAPGLFNQLYLYEPAIRRHVGEVSAKQLALQEFFVNAAKARRSSFPSRDAALANFARKKPMSQFQAAALAAYVEHGFADSNDGDGVELKCTPSTESLCYANGFRHNIADMLSGVRCPVTLMRGSETSADQREAIAEIAPDLTTSVLVLDGAGHCGPMEQPARFAREVLHRYGSGSGSQGDTAHQ